jgi:hypothetical protein
MRKYRHGEKVDLENPEQENVLRPEDLRAVVMNSSIFWVITPCSPLKVNLHFKVDDKPARNQHEAGCKQRHHG